MRTVELTRELVLEAPVETPDGRGGRRREWRELGTLWADMRPRSGREARGEGVRLSLSSWRILVRASPVGAESRPRPGQRFREGERVFDILAVTETDGGARWLTCLAEEERSA
ncbi:head-tail adaptor protein [Palleronia rufa]|uniref:head-tail adaptor protein n=1 Tax=Palleronia rufa TaxID=1530186 RepID=UPI000565C7DB|nr:head-tail adaptor protein [Palleronia rufa]